MNIKILSASDRNNYGDLLFPLIVQKYVLKYFPDVEIENYGIFSSDLSDFGALPTRSLKALKNSMKEDNTILIIAGGEVLSSGDWLNIYRFVSPFWNYLNKFRLTRVIVKKSGVLNLFLKYKYSSSKPFILDGKSYKFKKICYNSVGATGLGIILNNKNYKYYFENLTFLSVRDHLSKKNFSSFKIPCHLSPDSALIISDIFKDELKSEISTKCKKLIERPYLFIQFGNKKGPDQLDLFLKELEIFSNEIKVSVLLCPIGLALGHEDDIILKKIQQINNNFNYYEPKNLYETMFLLKNTVMYMGTSLHGLITAQSFGLPFYLFNDKISKVKFYLETWGSAEFHSYGSFYDFDKVRKRFYEFNRELEYKYTEYQKHLVYLNFENIFSNL